MRVRACGAREGLAAQLISRRGGKVGWWVGRARALTALTVAVSGSVTRCVARAMGAVIER